ncbi:MAG: hypothetical protein H8E46_03475 [FCB group bacterium]|nr:hypothetical protein [FCB group bacterium]
MLVCEAAFETSDADIISISLGGAGCAGYNFNHSGRNPAGQFSGSGFRMSYRNIYGMPELKQSSLAYYTSKEVNSFSVILSDFGNKVYREDALTVNYSRELRGGFSACAGISNYYLSLNGLGSDYTAGLNGGLSWSPGEMWNIGASVMNINDPSLGEQKDRIGRKYACGFGYFPAESIRLFGDVVKEDRFPADFRAGLEFALSEIVTIRAGVNSPEPQLSGGFSVYHQRFSFLYAFRNHNYLGASHMFGVQILTGGTRSE